MFLILDDAPNFVASCWIYTANSCVGTNTKTIGPSPKAKHLANKKKSHKIKF
jgi:hypothetical protein